MNVLQYASIMEIFQLLIASIGLCLAMWGIWIAFEDAIELVDAPPDDLRRLVALGNMRAQLARVSAQGTLVFVGIISVLLPPPVAALSEVINELEQSFLVRIGLIIVTVILTTDSFSERRQRGYFMDRIKSRVRVSSRPQEVAVLIAGKEVARGEVSVPPVGTEVQANVPPVGTEVQANDVHAQSSPTLTDGAK